jgi:hypothetical protein
VATPRPTATPAPDPHLPAATDASTAARPYIARACTFIDTALGISADAYPPPPIIPPSPHTAPPCAGPHHIANVDAPWWANPVKSGLFARLQPVFEFLSLSSPVSDRSQDGHSLFIHRFLTALDTAPCSTIPPHTTQGDFDLCPTCAIRWTPPSGITWHSPRDDQAGLQWQIQVIYLFQHAADSFPIWAHQVPPTAAASQDRRAAYEACEVLGQQCDVPHGLFHPSLPPAPAH